MVEENPEIINRTKRKYLLWIPSTLFILMGTVFLIGNIAVLISILSVGNHSDSGGFLTLLIPLISSILYISIGIGVRKGNRAIAIVAAIFSIFWITISPVYLLSKLPITLIVNGLMFFGIVFYFNKSREKTSEKVDVG